MKNKEFKKEINLITPKITVISFNGINLKRDMYNQDLFFNGKNFVINKDNFVPIHNGTISSTIENDKNDKNQFRNININNACNKETLSQDKFIQTPPNFYSIENTEKNENFSFTPNKKFIKKNKTYKKIFKSKKNYQNFEDNKNIPRIYSGIRPTYFSKNFLKNFETIQITNHSRKREYPMINNNKAKSKGIKHVFKNINILKEYFNNTNKDNNKRHHNLLTIENIYFGNKSFRQRYKLDNDGDKEYYTKYKMPLLNKKYSIKEIKYPLCNSINRKYKIINDNNAHLLEEVFKKQTLSNFNNKYALKYKTNNNSKKENIKNLFSLLKKYKYSDRDKQSAFNKYHSLKKSKKHYIIM